uniref:Si:ch73-389k6.1 n=1 Tax=Steinernema glaseri TaxID=37863 RepID=A0A1I8ABQ1_9BILA
MEPLVTQPPVAEDSNPPFPQKYDSNEEVPQRYVLALLALLMVTVICLLSFFFYGVLSETLSRRSFEKDPEQECAVSVTSASSYFTTLSPSSSQDSSVFFPSYSVPLRIEILRECD